MQKELTMLMFTQTTLFVSFLNVLYNNYLYNVTNIVSFTVKLIKTVCYECESSNFSNCSTHPKLTFVKDTEVPMVSYNKFFDFANKNLRLLSNLY